jgi:DNA helicase HerA-like ATPase
MSNNIDDILDSDPMDEQTADQSNKPKTESESESESTQLEDSTPPDAQPEVPETPVPHTTSPIEEGEIGHVLASEGIRVSRDQHNVNVFVTTEKRDDVRVGDYVQIPYPDSDDELFSVIDGLRYEPYTELDDKSDTHNQITKQRQLNESEFVVIGELDLIAIVGENHDTDEFERGIVNKIPKPNASVSLSRDDEFLRTGLNMPQDGIFAGYLSVGGDRMEINGEPFPYYLKNPGIDQETGKIEDGEPTVFRHSLVAGSTGAGKTHFTKNLLRQFVSGKRYPVDTGNEDGIEQSRLNVVVFDPENEYCEMRKDNPDLTDEQRQTLRQQGVNFDGIDNLSVFVPEVDHTVAPKTGGQQALTVPFSIVQDEPRLLMPFDQMTDVTRGAIERCISAYFDSFEDNSPWDNRPVDRPRYEDFTTFLRDHDHEESQLRERFGIGSGTWSAVRRRVISRDYFDVFDGGINPFPDISDQLFREGQLTVIPTSHLRGEKEYLVVLALLSYIIENKIDDFNVDSQVKRTPMLISVDEAHNYFSEPNNIREQYIVSRARAAAKQGRKDKLGLMMVTQNPDDIDGEILKQTNSNIFLQLRDEVVDDVPSVPSEYKQDIPNFSKGQAVLKAPDVEAVEVVGLPYCLVQHSN